MTSTEESSPDAGPPTEQSPDARPPAEQPASPSGPLWHYTDAAGLLGILGNVDQQPDPDVVGSGTFKPVLWATAAQFLNDRRELTHGLNLILEYLREWGGRGLFQSNPDGELFVSKVCETIQSIIDRKYPHYLHCCTVSFSEDPDMLSQWRGYGQGTGGFAIGFDPAAFPRSDGSSVHRAGLGLHQVQYLSDALEQPLIDAVYWFIAELWTRTSLRSRRNTTCTELFSRWRS